MTWPTVRRALAIVLTLVGLAVIAYSLHLNHVNPRGSDLDNWEWRVFSTGAAMAGAGISLSRMRLIYVPLVAAVSPYIAFYAILSLIWGVVIICYCLHDLLN